MSGKPTRIKKLKIEKFRALENIEIEIADRITLICGKNGLSKSSILGLIAQPFNFITDYTNGKEEGINFKCLSGLKFISTPAEHFRLSKEHDNPSDMRIGLEIYDASVKKNLDGLKLTFSASKDREFPRAVLRNNTGTLGKNTSRKITHPVIYLGVKRLFPITSREYETVSQEYIEKNKDELCKTINTILLRSSFNPENRLNQITTTTGMVPSIVSHSQQYDHQSVSVGDDNVGQIVQALYSFQYLKENFENYTGGLLLIDEADAALFPAAQQEFFKILEKFAKKLNLQIVITSHSTTLIEIIYERCKQGSRQISLQNKDYKLIYLTDAFGKIEVKEDFSWVEILADINVQAISVSEEICLPKVNIYFEDDEAKDFYEALVLNRKIKKITNRISAKIGSETIKTLIGHKIPEFEKLSISCLDGDVTFSQKINDNVCCLPGELPPDQLIFEFLYNLPPDAPFWKEGTTRPVFERELTVQKIIEKLQLAKDEETEIKLTNYIQRANLNKGETRSLFKDFYKSNTIQNMLVRTDTNPFRHYIKDQPNLRKNFISLIVKALKYTLGRRGVAQDKIHSYLRDC